MRAAPGSRGEVQVADLPAEIAIERAETARSPHAQPTLEAPALTDACVPAGGPPAWPKLPEVVLDGVEHFGSTPAGVPDR